MNFNGANQVEFGKSFKEGAFGVPDTLVYGLNKVSDKVAPLHPLEEMQKNHAAIQERTQMAGLVNVQGLHAPLRLAMERRAVQQVGRLPFLPSSNLHLQVLQGTDTTIDFTDVLNTPDARESLYMPHAVMERDQGIL